MPSATGFEDGSQCCNDRGSPILERCLREGGIPSTLSRKCCGVIEHQGSNHNGNSHIFLTHPRQKPARMRHLLCVRPRDKNPYSKSICLGCSIRVHPQLALVRSFRLRQERSGHRVLPLVAFIRVAGDWPVLSFEPLRRRQTRARERGS